MEKFLLGTLKSNKGYMLVELILATAIAFSIAYFAIDVTIKIKEKNDDLYISTLVGTDQAIITNGIMNYVKRDGADFECRFINIRDKTISYNNGKENSVIDVVNSNIDIGNYECDTGDGIINIKVPLSVKQMPDNDYDVRIHYKYIIPQIDFTFTILDVKTAKKPGNVNYEIQMKDGNNWILASDIGISKANKDFTASLYANMTYRVKTYGGGYPEQYSHTFTSNAGDPTHIIIKVFNGKPNEIVITLTWSQKIDDLDMHLYADGFPNNNENYHLWSSATTSRLDIGIGGASLDVDSNHNSVNFRPENMTIDRDKFNFELWIFNWSKYCFSHNNYNYCYQLYGSNTNNNNNNIDFADPVISIFDGGGGDGSNARWLDDITFPVGAAGSDKLTWKVLKYTKADHSFKVLNEFTDYPRGKYYTQ